MPTVVPTGDAGLLGQTVEGFDDLLMIDAHGDPAGKRHDSWGRKTPTVHRWTVPLEVEMAFCPAKAHADGRRGGNALRSPSGSPESSQVQTGAGGPFDRARGGGI